MEQKLSVIKSLTASTQCRPFEIIMSLILLCYYYPCFFRKFTLQVIWLIDNFTLLEALIALMQQCAAVLLLKETLQIRSLMLTLTGLFDSQVFAGKIQC